MQAHHLGVRPKQFNPVSEFMSCSSICFPTSPDRKNETDKQIGQTDRQMGGDGLEQLNQANRGQE